MGPSKLINLAMQYAQSHDNELVSFAYSWLKKGVQLYRANKIAARELLEESLSDLAISRAQADAEIAKKPE